MNRAQLVEKIADDAGIPKVAAGAVVKSVIEAVSRALKKEGRITLAGFGTFSKTKRKARKGRNPRTGEAIKIKASASVRFKEQQGVERGLLRKAKKL